MPFADERDVFDRRIRHDLEKVASDAIGDGRFAVPVADEKQPHHALGISGTSAKSRIAKRAEPPS